MGQTMMLHLDHVGCDGACGSCGCLQPYARADSGEPETLAARDCQVVTSVGVRARAKTATRSTPPVNRCPPSWSAAKLASRRKPSEVGAVRR
ncbi:hypothetical protein [Micromonospora yangpuensis]|uniref:Uncharacterized protein n=1 Tax=Micromonospora yangpuensis TaxID=683228 RepID=A0A1C6UWP9_9ACTN|nr:hypothetical protein [Micromonospora yangpuensis]GGM25596.1 hypothetical protein GCM10012279_50050 [Micromonospora yangpuensis]SCL58239.1 hypothetical protein GA0070617_3763 [Micromonospora yangpuensis]